MKRFKMVYALVAALSMLAILATGASAHEWLEAGKKITVATETTAKPTLRFENKLWGYAIECPLNEKGTVGPGAKDEITSILSSTGEKNITCTIPQHSGYCSEKAKIEAKALPWAFELQTVEGQERNVLLKTHEWKIECTGPLTNFTDWCEVTQSVALENWYEFVKEIFESGEKYPETYCFDTNNEGRSFETRGAVKLYLASKKRLEYN